MTSSHKVTQEAIYHQSSAPLGYGFPLNASEDILGVGFLDLGDQGLMGFVEKACETMFEGEKYLLIAK